MFQPRRHRKSLFDSFSLDAHHVTDVRRLLQNLHRQQKASSRDIRSYMVTSAGRGEGKSTISALMGLVSAMIFQRKTLLIDGDPYLPTIHSLLGVARSPGLAEALQQKAPSDTASHATVAPLLSVMPCGHPIGSASRVYSDEEFPLLLEDVRSRYDVVFIDAPPAVPTIEPLLMAEHVDAILLVAMASRTPLTMVRRAKELLEPMADKIAGVILNNALDGLPYYYDYRYHGYAETGSTRIRKSSSPHSRRGD
jgi:capsular exopolysaccharide synthesis family protein